MEHGFLSDPEELFSESGLKRLEEYPLGKRLGIIRFAATDLRTKPSMCTRYFSRFPLDLNVIKYEFFDDSHLQSSEMWSLFTLLAKQNTSSRQEDMYGDSLEQARKIAERRELVDQVLMREGYEYSEEAKAGFGGAIEGYHRALSDARDISARSDRYMDTAVLFNDAYVKLPELKQIDFLRFCLAKFHNDLVFEEVFNSDFTKESVQRDKSRYLNIMKSARYLPPGQIRNEAHSMIFKTYQPAGAYNISQGDFEYEMNTTVLGADHWKNTLFTN